MEPKGLTPLRRMTVLLAIATVVVVAGAVVVGAERSAAPAVSAPAAAVAMAPFVPMTTATGAAVGPPWERPSEPTERARLAGLTMLGTEGTAFHIHAHLTVTIDGVAETVPGEVGIDNPSSTVSPLHTHDTTGIIHVESPVQADFTLGQFFTEWNVRLDGTGIGSATNSDSQQMTVFVNQHPYTGYPAAIVFTNKMDIDIVVAPAGSVAASSAPFDWPSQY